MTNSSTVPRQTRDVFEATSAEFATETAEATSWAAQPPSREAASTSDSGGDGDKWRCW